MTTTGINPAAGTRKLGLAIAAITVGFVAGVLTLPLDPELSVVLFGIGTGISLVLLEDLFRQSDPAWQNVARWTFGLLTVAIGLCFILLQHGSWVAAIAVVGPSAVTIGYPYLRSRLERETASSSQE